MKKIICFVSAMNVGGAETFMMKIYRTLEGASCKIDFISTGYGKYDDEIKLLGGNVYIVPRKSVDFIGWYRAVYNILKSHKYDAALRMTSNSLGMLDLIVAKMAGIKILAVRATNSDDESCVIRVLSKLFFWIPRCFPNRMIAPSNKAAKYVFGSRATTNGKVKIIQNGLDLKKFAFNNDIRVKTRMKLGVNEDVMLVGFVGRFTKQKNQMFAVDILGKITESKVYMLFIGEGENEKEINDIVQRKSLGDRTKFLSNTNEIENYMMAMDLLILPSLYEGMPNVVVEAQATELPVFASDRITRECNLTNMVKFFPINSGDEEVWAKNIEEFSPNDNRMNHNGNKMLETLGYEINDVKEEFISYILHGR